MVEALEVLFVFVAAPQGGARPELLLGALPDLLAGALATCDVGCSTRSGHIVCLARVRAAQGVTPRLREHLARWAREHGASMWSGGDGVRSIAGLLLEGCDLSWRGVAGTDLANVASAVGDRGGAGAGRAPPSPPPVVRPRALVVDDDLLARRMLRDALTERGFDVIVAEDATEGLRLLTDHLLDLDALVTDVRMPGMDGEAFIRVIRQAGGERDLAIIVVTASYDERLAARIRRVGADAVLAKRMGSEQIAAVASATLARRAAGA